MYLCTNEYAGGIKGGSGINWIHCDTVDCKGARWAALGFPGQSHVQLRSKGVLGSQGNERIGIIQRNFRFSITRTA